MTETRTTALKVAKGDANAAPTCAEISFCESSASLQLNGITIHVPWTELAVWHVWLAEFVEERAT